MPSALALGASRSCAIPGGKKSRLFGNMPLLVRRLPCVPVAQDGTGKGLEALLGESLTHFRKGRVVMQTWQVSCVKPW